MMSEQPRETGIIKTFVAVRQDAKGHRKGGYGFIAPDDGGIDVFVHIKAMKSGELQEGAHVEFERGVDRDKRVRAVKVVVL